MKVKKEFIVEHSICKGWYLNKKLKFIKNIEEARTWNDEKIFKKEIDSPVGRCSIVLSKGFYKLKYNLKKKNKCRSSSVGRTTES